MYDVSEAINICYKPYDIVSDRDGNVGFIQEVNINHSQPNIKDQYSYAVNWFYGNNRFAWFDHDELKKHCNFFEKIAECSCHPFGQSKNYISRIMNL